MNAIGRIRRRTSIIASTAAVSVAVVGSIMLTTIPLATSTNPPLTRVTASAVTTNRSVPPSLNVHGSVMQLISQNDGMNRLGANPNISVDESGATAIVVPWVGTVPSWLESGIKAIAAETGSSVTVVSARNTQSEMMLAAAELHSLFPDDARVSTSVEIGIDSLVFRGPALPDVVHASSSPDDDAWAAFMEDAAERIAFDGVGITFVEEESVPEPAM